MSDLVWIEPVEKPVSFADVAFTEADWKAAQKVGALEVFPSNAVEAIRNSRGLYRFQPAKKTEIEVKVGGMSVEQMDAAQLKMIAASFSKPIRKQMKMSELRKFVQGLIDAVPITDDEDEVAGDAE